MIDTETLRTISLIAFAIACIVPAVVGIAYLVAKAVGLGWFRAKRLSEKREDEELNYLFFKELRDGSQDSTGEGKSTEAPDQR